MTRRIIVIGDTLFAIAAREYGDPLAWIRIADVNGLSDILIDTITTIALPEGTTDTTGGIVTP